MSDMQTSFAHESGLLIVKNVQDVEPILQNCKERSAEGMHGSGEMKHAASFPMVLIEAYCNKANITFQEWLKNKDHIKSMLNDPDLSGFRIWPGRV